MGSPGPPHHSLHRSQRCCESAPKSGPRTILAGFPELCQLTLELLRVHVLRTAYRSRTDACCRVRLDVQTGNAGGTAPTKQQLIDTAVAWVRYANITQGYGVKYREIGNESYVNSYNGGAKAYDYAPDLVEFAQGMKAVHPTIPIGTNGPDSQYARGELDASVAWWQTVLTIAAPAIDFLAVHSYPAWEWGSYEYYRTKTPKLTGAADGATAALAVWAPAHAQRIQIAVTEMNSADLSKGGWSSDNNNSLGHPRWCCSRCSGHTSCTHGSTWPRFGIHAGSTPRRPISGTRSISRTTGWQPDRRWRSGANSCKCRWSSPLIPR